MTSFESETAARAEATATTEETVARIQREGDRVAAELAKRLSLPDGATVAFELEPLDP